MIDELIKLANYFDKKGLVRHANELDELIKESSLCQLLLVGINQLLGCRTLSTDKYGCPQMMVSGKELGGNGEVIYNKLEFTDSKDTTEVNGIIIGQDLKPTGNENIGYVDIRFTNVPQDCKAIFPHNLKTEEDGDSVTASIVVRIGCVLTDKPESLKDLSSESSTVVQGVEEFGAENENEEKITFKSKDKYLQWLLPQGLYGEKFSITELPPNYIIAKEIERVQE